MTKFAKLALAAAMFCGAATAVAAPAAAQPYFYGGSTYGQQNPARYDQRYYQAPVYRYDYGRGHERDAYRRHQVQQRQYWGRNDEHHRNYESRRD